MKILIPVIFVLVALVQLFVPAELIINREYILKTGKEYKFRTIPVDPVDRVKGKYVSLEYKVNTFINNDTTSNWRYGQDVYLQIAEDKEGFVKIVNIFHEKPTGLKDYVKAKISGYQSVYENLKIIGKEFYIKYPFNTYYIEETKAKKTEAAYKESAKDSTRITYALVKIKNGEAVLKDVIIDGVSVKEIAKKK